MEFLAKEDSFEELYVAHSHSKIGGVAGTAAEFLQKEQLLDKKLWRQFVNQFRIQPDAPTLAWRGEYWGKMMRGAVSVYHYTRSESLYNTLLATVLDMMTVAEEDGRVSTYERGAEFCGWDIWCRKYVLLGMLYFYDICKDESVKEKIIAFTKAAADYIVERIGRGKIEITRASSSWFGVNSSSILEPMVWLYKLTGEKRYLDFSTYIVECGGAEGVNIFELAYENKLMPYQYGVAKAYEVTSCFEGLIAYYSVTGIEKYKTAAINYGLAILESDVSVIGSLGCTHELLDHSRYTQTAHRGKREMETCVTVTWMKYCATLYRLTGDRRFADAIEKSFYNAYLGAINYEKSESDWMWVKWAGTPTYDTIVPSFMPFDSYSPLTPGRRGIGVGGNQMLEDGSYYGCCACIGSVGIGIYAAHRLLCGKDGITLSFFDRGEDTVKLGNGSVKVLVSGAYPAEGNVEIKLTYDNVSEGVFKLRLPAWAQIPVVECDIDYEIKDGFITFRPDYTKENIICVSFDMPIREIYPQTWVEDTVYTDMTGSENGWHFAKATKIYHSPEFDDYICLERGPIVLAADSSRSKAADSVFSFAKDEGKIVAKKLTPDCGELLKLEFKDEEGKPFCLVDYASAGKDWKSDIAAWLPTK